MSRSATVAPLALLTCVTTSNILSIIFHQKCYATKIITKNLNQRLVCFDELWCIYIS